MYAVDPAEVRENAERLTADSIVARCLDLMPTGPDGKVRGGGMWVTLSGGNPALMDFDRAPMKWDFIAGLQRHGFRVSVETQGSVWRDWLATVDHLTISPKPPSSGMYTVRHDAQTKRFMHNALDKMHPDRRSLKIVVFDDWDYDWARDRILMWGEGSPMAMRAFLSVGTDQDALQDEYRIHAGIADRYRWLCERVAADPVMREVRVMPQLHVIAWGMKRGV